MTKILKKKFKNILTKRTNDGIIRPSKRSREKTKQRNQEIKKSEIHSIHSIDAHERMKKGKGDSSGNITITSINMRVTGTGFPARKT